MGILGEVRHMRGNIDRELGLLKETTETLKSIKKGKFSDTKEPFYDIETLGGAVALSANEVSSRIEELNPGDKLKYKRSCWCNIVEIYDMKGNPIYKMKPLV